MFRTAFCVAASLAAAAPATAQLRVAPFVGVGLTGIRAVQHGYQDVSQFGWVSALGLSAGLVAEGTGPLAAEVSLEHARSGQTMTFDANLLPTGRFETTARTTMVSAAALIGRSSAAVRWRAGFGIARQDGMAALAPTTRLGIRTGAVIVPLRIGPVRAGFDLAVTRFFSSDPGFGWTIAPAVRVGF
ncbi:MAG: hypothetical protein JNJ80_05250 [Gemmatimonadetes bacterium]|nr:hypothetical protein [Gemmatimonadota bacterium]